jgi:single-strand DNA-binding protein
LLFQSPENEPDSKEDRMSDVNRVFLTGRLGHRPEVKLTAEGKPYTRLSIATEKYLGPTKDGATLTQWFPVMVWGQQAETVSRHLVKGQGVMVEARVDTYEVEREAGKKETRVGLQAIHVNFLQRPKPKSSEEPAAS